MKRSYLISSVALLALAACGDAENAASKVEGAATDLAADAGAAVENTTAAAADAMTPAADANTPTGYAMNAAMSDMFEIESSRVALEKSQSPEVKQFAQMMIDGHTKTTAELKSTLTSANIQMTPPATLDERRQGMVADLRQASATEFDRTYVDQQTKAHGEALELHRGYAENGDNAQLKAFAAKTAPAVQQHLDMVKKLDQTGADEPASNPPQ